MVQLSRDRDPGANRVTGLVERAAGGDRQAQQELLLAHLCRIRRVVRRLVGPTDEVEDLVQASCVEVLKGLRRFQGESSFGVWAERVTAHVVYNHFRSNRRRRRRIEFRPDPGPHAVDPGQPGRVEWIDALGYARALLEQIEPKRRLILLLVALEGHTVEEAARTLGISLSAAKSRYLRARRDLERLLEEHPELVQAVRGRGTPSEQGGAHG